MPAASVTTTVFSPSGAPTSRAARSSSAAAATATSGVRSDGFHTTVSPQTSAIAAFHAHTAHGKLNAEITPTTPSGCHVSISRCPGRSEGIVRPLELAGEPDGEIADVDHLLDLAAGLGDDLADLHADQVGQSVLVLGQQLAEPLDQPAARRRRDGAPRKERRMRAVDRPLDVPGVREGHRGDGLAGDGADDVDAGVAGQGVRVGAAAAQRVGGEVAQLGGRVATGRAGRACRS